MFHIVDFISAEKKETEVVPSSWVQDGMSYWPPYSSTERCTRAVKRQETPDKTWGLFDVNIRYTRDTYEEARHKLPMAVVQSDLQTEEDDHPAYMKRKGRGRNTQIFSDTESEDEPSAKFPRKDRSVTSKGLPPAPVIRPPEDRRETPGTSNTQTRTEPNIQQQLCDRKCYLWLPPETSSLGKAPDSNLDEVPDLTDLRLPMSSLEDLKRVEGQLSDQGIKKNLTAYLGLSGGMTTKENVWRILGKLLTNALAMKINWRGANGKQAFEPLALKSVVIGHLPTQTIKEGFYEIAGLFSGLLVGDRGYACQPFLMTPYPDPNTRPQNYFNVALNRTRVEIEMTFGILKARFNCLRGLRVAPDRACQVVTACVVLHNVASIRRERAPPVSQQPPDVVDPITLDYPTGRAAPGVPDAEIEKYIKRWMQLSPDRDGGRKRRERGRSDQTEE
ncbi:uncharacterized protein LOC134020631 [Osmerus eperlanus]|uniref:uncharacterized protein LOC134020631 n=1 Tax=Osmerus eperlanus TaxID=29151 RepID=UPI002E10576D